MLRLVALVFLVPCLTGCTPDYTILEHRDVSLPVGEKPHLFIEMANGSIDITSTSGKDVTGKLTKRGVGVDKEEAEAELAAIAFDMIPNQDGKIVIRVKRTDGRKQWNSSGAEATLQVPKGSKLELVSTNASIRVNGRNQGTIAKTSNGSIDVKDTQSWVDLTTTNGSVECEAIQGPVKIATSNAKVQVNGRDLLLDCKTSNGSIRCTGNLVDGDHKATTSNAHITMQLPRDTAVNVEATTSNGRIKSDFNYLKTDFGFKSSKNYVKGTIGNDKPGKTLTLKTSNSSISLKRNGDTKSTDTVEE